MIFNDIELSILINDRPVTEYPHMGQTYVEGRAGSNFQIEVRNRRGVRVEAVISVDGLSIINGKEAGPQSEGYLIDAYSVIRIPGWKLNDSQIAAFEFAGKKQSYAAQSTGSARNTGVIGVMTFAEKPKPRAYTTGYLIGSSAGTPRSFTAGTGDAWGTMGLTGNMAMNSVLASCAPDSVATASMASTSTMRSANRSKGMASVDSNPVQQSLGTAFGEAQSFATTSVEFERGDMVAMAVIYYDDLRGLKARGVPVDRKTKQKKTELANAFPGMSGCTPPAGWRGHPRG